MESIYDQAKEGTLNKSSLDQYRATTAEFYIDKPNSNDETLLGIAARHGHVDMVKLLLGEGASVNKRSGNCSSLWLATAGTIPPEKRIEIIRILLEEGADIDTPSGGGYTPLMKVIEYREIDAIKLLRARGASIEVTLEDGRTVIDLAKSTKDPYVISAVSPTPHGILDRGHLIEKIVDVINVILFTVNDATKEVMKLYGITGEDILETRREMNVDDPRTAAEFEESINSYVTQTGLGDFFPKDDPFLQTVAAKAAALREDPSVSLDFVRDLTILSLYQPILFCDDSRSMIKDGRYEAQKKLVGRISSITTRLVPDDEGIGVRFINDNYDKALTDASSVERVVASVEPRGATEIGTMLRRKILDPYIYHVLENGGRLRRPLLISVITDGYPQGPRSSSERTDTFKEEITDCFRYLVENHYQRTAVRFQISQVGSDPKAKEFLDGLKGSGELQRLLYCTTDQLDAQYETFKDNERDLEIWLLELLMSPIIDRDID